MLPEDGPLGLPLGALRPLALAVLAAGAVLGLALTHGGGTAPGGRRLRLGWPGVLLVAVAVRLALSLSVDGGLYDVFHAYHLVGTTLRTGGDVFVEPALGLANYAPLVYWWWAAASAVPDAHPHLYAALVRAPFWLADASVAVALVRLLPGRRGVAAGLVYALSPVAAAVPTLHGQFEPWVLLPLLVGVAALPEHPGRAGLLLGLATAVKPWPLFLIVPLVAAVAPRARPRLVVPLAAVPLASFALYGLVHPEHVLDGVDRVVTYQAHRQGLGTGWLIPDAAPAAVVIALNMLAGAVGSLLGLAALRRGASVAAAAAVTALALVTLCPTVSDQYLVWPVPLLLLGGHPRAAAALGAALLPAVAGLDLWTSQDSGATPVSILALATLATAAATCAVLAVAAPLPAARPLGTVAAAA